MGAFLGAAICLAAVGFNLFGDAVRSLLDPKARRSSHDPTPVLDINKAAFEFPGFGRINTTRSTNLYINREINGLVENLGTR